MRAEPGAVDRVHIENGQVEIHVIGETAAKGICGSGIVDLLAEMFLNGWIDVRGRYVEEASEKIREVDGALAAEYAPGLFFFQKDIEEFLKTKAAAGTMVEYMMGEVGLTHISKEAGVTVGLYPDMPRDKIVLPGNSSLTGARKMLLHKEIKEEVEKILDKMTYIQFGAVDNFLHLMAAAEAIPIHRYPTVEKELKKRGLL